MKPKITFEKLPDGTQVVTVKSKNVHGDVIISQQIIEYSAVFNALKEASEGGLQAEVANLKSLAKSANDDYLSQTKKCHELEAEVERLKKKESTDELTVGTDTLKALLKRIDELESERDQWKARCLDAAIDYSKPKL